jgi:hypothetical protein
VPGGKRPPGTVIADLLKYSRNVCAAVYARGRDDACRLRSYAFYPQLDIFLSPVQSQIGRSLTLGERRYDVFPSGRLDYTEVAGKLMVGHVQPSML